jgi:hypothetical protein
MATTNRFQTRVLIPDKTPLTTNEIRLNSLLTDAQTCYQTLNNFQTIESNNNLSRKSQLDHWSTKTLGDINELHQTCLTDLKQSFEQLKSFQQMMSHLLNNDQENYLDGKKLLAIGHEISILRCLTFQLDTSKVKIEGQLKLTKINNENQQEIMIDDENDEQNQMKLTEKKDFICRILLPKDSITVIENFPLFQEFVQIKTDEINSTTPERILTINGKQFL